MLTSEYKRLRRLGWRASDAARAARVTERFDDAEAEELVRIHTMADYDADTSYWTPDDYARAERDGVWGLCSDYRCPLCGGWVSADSVFGFIGDDYHDSGYDTDVKAEALRLLADATRTPFGRGFGHCAH